MKYSITTLIVQTVVASVALAAPLEKRAPKTLNLSFDVVLTNNNDTGVPVQSRDETIPIQYRDLQYKTQITMGSNKQSLYVGLDTGSSNLWFPSTDATCLNGMSCKAYGTFNEKTSTTYKNLSIPIHANFVDGNNAFGYYATDDYYFPDGTKLPNFQFGLVTQDARYSGLLGIGLESKEYTPKEYPNFPFALKNAGIIDHAAYSLYLNKPDAQSGNILFGGVDTAKYDGDLTILDVADYPWIGVPVQSYTLPDGTTHDLQIDVALDSGTTYIGLIPSVGGPILDALNVDAFGYTYCDSVNFDDHLTFNFDGVSIEIPYTLLFRDQGNNVCRSSIFLEDSDSSGNFFGDTFLQNAYVAYNLDTNKIGLAQANYATASDVVDFWF
ncbi:hypothetical protein KGF54_000087 [Candida jiufengensis]|uniref:uncharacterized protein n=1 Tax=Candida jiufengensis TaxID=497108 RepID=UPI0022241134|nr:uncharacterized protein KGF54_000087 [Candida jiufengensis]KAI5957159.1 hypothetical protein KGF54_000087 [Candida jiufengensis]